MPMTTSPKRSPNASLRVSVAKDLDEITKAVKYLRYRWCGVRSTVYESGELRPRRLDEYPENDAAEWTNLADWAYHISQNALALANEAREQAAEMNP